MKKVNHVTLFLQATEVEFGLGVVKISPETVEQAINTGVHSVCVWKKLDDSERFEIYYTKQAELDYNGHDHYVRFVPNKNPVASYPGTGMFSKFEIESALRGKASVALNANQTPHALEMRMLSTGLHFGERIRERVRDYTAHLDIKDMSIARIQDELSKHRSVLRKDYWIWEDDFKSNDLPSLNCPILIEPHQLQQLLANAQQNKLDFKDA